MPGLCGFAKGWCFRHKPAGEQTHVLDVVDQGGLAFVRRTARTAADSNNDSNTGGSGRLWAPTAPRASRSQPAMDGSELPKQKFEAQGAVK
jgi:hypothetical protein